MTPTFDIILDVDDVLFPWSAHAHAAIVRAGMDNGAVITRWDCHNDYGITSEEFWGVITRAYMDGMLMQEPYPGVIEEILLLQAAGHRVHIVTARGFEGAVAQIVRDETANWLLRYGIPHDSLTFTKNKASVPADYALDDNAGNVTALRAVGVEAFLRTQDHNLSNTVLPRMADLTAFVGHVLEEVGVMV